MGEVQSIIDSVTILNANAREPYPAADGVSSLLRLSAFPTGGGAAPSLWASFACGSAPSSICATRIAQTLIDGDLFRFELDVGSGAAGSLKWWINAEFTDPPTGSAENLDNAEWRGVQTVALGAFQPQGRVALNGTTLRFHQIESTDDTLFWNGFDN